MKFNMLEFVEENAPELETTELYNAVNNLSVQVLENERDYLEFLELNEYSKDDFSFLDYLQLAKFCCS